MLIKELKERMFAAMKAKNTVEKEILRTAIGEVTSTGADPDDARVVAVVKKLMKSNQETLKSTQDTDQKSTLEQELEILSQFVPKSLSVEQIIDLIQSVADPIKNANNDGQAIGVAMKQLKSTGAEVDGKDVAAAVKSLRA